MEFLKAFFNNIFIQSFLYIIFYLLFFHFLLWGDDIKYKFDICLILSFFSFKLFKISRDLDELKNKDKK